MDVPPCIRSLQHMCELYLTRVNQPITSLTVNDGTTTGYIAPWWEWNFHPSHCHCRYSLRSRFANSDLVCKQSNDINWSSDPEQNGRSPILLRADCRVCDRGVKRRLQLPNDCHYHIHNDYDRDKLPRHSASDSAGIQWRFGFCLNPRRTFRERRHPTGIRAIDDHIRWLRSSI